MRITSFRCLSVAAGLILTAALDLVPAALAQSVTEFPVPGGNSQPFGIAKGADNALWFTDTADDAIGRITTDGSITQFGVPTAGANPFSITAGPDSALWFTEVDGEKIGRVALNGSISEFDVPDGGGPGGIALGSDGALWFTQIPGGMIGRITTAGKIEEFDIPTSGPLAHQITAGPDGNLWFPEVGGNKIGRITTAGKIEEFPLPNANSEPFGITTGPDGNLWFAEFGAGRVGRITPAGTITEFDLSDPNSQPLVLTAGSDGAIWFTEANSGLIGRISTTGKLEEFTVPTGNSSPQGITAGPDGDLWFDEQAVNQIGRLTPAASTSPLVAAVLPSSRSVVVGTTATAFATIINSATSVAESCAPSLVTSVPIDFRYQTTDSATNAVTGTPNTPVAIQPGAAQSFVLSFSTNADFVPSNVVIGFACSNEDAAPSAFGLNTLLLAASTTATADVIALTATESNDGIVDIAGPDGSGAFALATDNLGAAATLTVSADVGTADLPVSLAICQTASDGACLAAPAPSLQLAVDANDTPTFAVFVQGSGTVPFAPAVNRVFVQFVDSTGAIRGSTSVAVRTQ
jgi:virginiamycin B lyase